MQNWFQKSEKEILGYLPPVSLNLNGFINKKSVY